MMQSMPELRLVPSSSPPWKIRPNIQDKARRQFRNTLLQHPRTRSCMSSSVPLDSGLQTLTKKASERRNRRSWLWFLLRQRYQRNIQSLTAFGQIMRKLCRLHVGNTVPAQFLGGVMLAPSRSLLLDGTVPPELGNLVNLRNLFLTANNLIGELPAALMNLTKLTKLRINSNNFTGRIPDIFQSWNQLQKLEIQASGLEGPIPSSISVLSNLTELMISGLNGGGSVFPNLRNMISLQRLMLRSCNLSGPIPPYLSAMSQLKILDLSFNRLVGSIPDLAVLTSLQNLLDRVGW